MVAFRIVFASSDTSEEQVGTPMNLETTLEPRVWEAVRASFEARRFKEGVLDAIHLLTDVIRERSGEDGDGVALIGAAFGGNSPKLKINRLATETERNIQRGMEWLLRGFYQAIRNPRSHEAFEDNEPDAKTLVLFVDYLLRVVDKSDSPFSLPAIVERILEPDFVPSLRYANLLIDEIPPKKCLPTCREVFANRKQADAQKISHFFSAIMSKMLAEENAEFLLLVSHELRETNEDSTLRFVLAAFPSSIWPRLEEIARIRSEHKLIQSIKEGKRNPVGKCLAGSLGTWATSILQEFTLKEELWNAVFESLGSGNILLETYVFGYFTRHVQQSFESPPNSLRYIVVRKLKAGDKRFKALAESWKSDWPEENPPEHPWVKPFAESLANFVEAEETSDPESFGSFRPDEEIPF